MHTSTPHTDTVIHTLIYKACIYRATIERDAHKHIIGASTIATSATGNSKCSKFGV